MALFPRLRQILARLADVVLWSRSPGRTRVLEFVHDAVLRIDPAGRLRYCNRAAAELFGLDAGHDLGADVRAAIRLVDGEAVNAQPVELLDLSAGVLPPGTSLRRHDGALRVLEGELRVDGGERMLVVRDVSDARRAERWMNFQLTHDHLTTLLNRNEMERRIEHAIRHAQRGRKTTLLYIDLDQFKIINDTCGHQAGDEFLRVVGKLLLTHLQRSDAVARLGGDEFAVLLPGRPANVGAALADNLIEAIHDVRFCWEQRIFRVTASIGVVEIDAQFRTWRDVLALADSACYLAKDHGRHRTWIAREEDELVRQRREQMDWVARITGALEDDRFVVYRQPITALGNNHNGAHWEVLTRLAEPGLPLAGPNLFIPAAERYGLMPSVDRWVFERVLRELSDGRHAPMPGSVAVNISGATLSDDSFTRFVAGCFKRYHVDPRRICFEITETAAATDFDAALRFINAMRTLGSRLALDDFGAGLSSFSYLKAFRVDYLKIDGAFVRDMDSDDMNARFVESINHLGKALGLATIAEYVESARVVECLRGLGVDYAQGNFLGRPQHWINGSSAHA